MWRIFCANFSLLSFLCLNSFLQAAPETFDHLSAYKQLQPTVRGPLSEVVLQGTNRATAYYEYDNHNRLIKARFFNQENEDGEATYHYGQWGLATEELFNKKGELIEKLNYRYNNQGQLVGYTVTDALGKEVLRWDFSLTAGVISGGKRYVGNELTEFFQVTSQDKKRIQLLYNAQSEKQGEIIYLYQDKLLTERLKNDVTGQKKITYHYDQQGRLKSMVYWIFEKGTWQKLKEHQLNY